MNRFYLINDLRFNNKIEYLKYKGWIRKKQTRKWLRLTIPTINKKGDIIYKDKWELVKVWKGSVIK